MEGGRDEKLEGVEGVIAGLSFRVGLRRGEMGVDIKIAGGCHW